MPKREDDVIGRLDIAMEAVIRADPIEAKIRRAMKEGKLAQRTLAERRQSALAQGIIGQAELDHLIHTDQLRRDVIKVDNEVDYTQKQNFADKFARRFGASAASALAEFAVRDEPVMR